MRTSILIFVLISFILTSLYYSQNIYGENPLAHTYSIVAYDSESGEMGVAVQSHWFSVGSLVAWGEAGVGVVATQSFVNVSYGIRGLELLKLGLTPQEAVDSLISSDEGREFRQLAILDVKGRAAAFTGNKCIPFAGHIVGEHYSVQANLMKNKSVWPAMSKAFEDSNGPLAERMVAALEAAEKEEGDIRGQQSASILVVKGETTGKIWEDRIIDLRVEDNPEAVKGIKRVLKVYRAYEHMNKGDLAVEHGDMKLAMEEYSAAEEMFPQNEEMKYWHAVTLVNNGMLDDALKLFEVVFSKNNDWLILTPRLLKNGLLNVTEEELKRILSVGTK